MNFTATKALVPTKRIAPVPKLVGLNAVSLDLYPRQYQNDVIYSICIPEEPDGKYGPDGRIRMNPRFAEFIDVYV